MRQFRLAGPDVDYSRESTMRQFCGYGCIPLGGPALGSPARSGIHENEVIHSPLREPILTPIFCNGIDGQRRRLIEKVFFEYGVDNFHGLLHNMHSGGWDSLAK